VSEYGAGASIYQHEQNPPYRNRTRANGPWHPEEWQDEIHEQAWLVLAPRPYLWGNYVWVMFDFASDHRNEGDHPGRNDKGLVTYDRRTRKDAFFWYKANWTAEPLVYITSRRDTVRLSPATTVKVYSNCETVELFVNGVSQGRRTSPEHLFLWENLTLKEGPNQIAVEAVRGSARVTDSCYWLHTPGTPYRPPPDDPPGADNK
jgi:beta-galactosidase